MQGRGRQLLIRIVVAHLALGGLLVAAELLLRAKDAGEYLVYPPGVGKRIDTSAYAIGVKGISEIRINALGLRGDELAETHDWRILTVGNSATLCANLDHRETWPHLLQQKLNGRTRSQGVWVGNAGVASNRAAENAMQVRYLTESIPELDLVLVMAGIIDFILFLGRGSGWTPLPLDAPTTEREVLPNAFSRFSHPGGFDSFALASFGGAGKARTLLQDVPPGHYATMRTRRLQAKVIHKKLPDLTAALADFREKLERSVAWARAAEVEPVLLTQPTLYAPNLPRYLSDLLWYGACQVPEADRGPGESAEVQRYAVSALAEGMKAYNDVTRSVCEAQGVLCVDLARTVPRTEEVFYDDAHINESGAQLISDAVAERLARAFEIGPGKKPLPRPKL